MKHLEVQLSKQALKYYNSMNQPDKGRIARALDKLQEEPPQGDITALSGKDGYRLRVGGYRILFDIAETLIDVHSIAPRGQAYKGGF